MKRTSSSGVRLHSPSEIYRWSRAAWSVGGPWERFFILVPPIFVAYVGVVHLWLVLTNFTFYDWATFMWAAILFILLRPVWSNPILSARVVKGLAEDEETREEILADTRALAIAKYLESYGTDGRWRFGNWIGATYLVGYLGWGVLGLWFGGISNLPPLTSMLVYLGLSVALVILLLKFYASSVGKLFRAAEQRGIEIPR